MDPFSLSTSNRQMIVPPSESVDIDASMTIVSKVDFGIMLEIVAVGKRPTKSENEP